MPWPIALAFAAALGCWFGAVASAVAMLRHRRPDRGLVWYLWNGWAFFDGRNFLPTAAAHRRRLAGCAAGFAASALAMALLSVLAR